VEGECTVACEHGTLALEFAFRLSGLKLGSEDLLVVALQDVSAEKRRSVLERHLVATLLDTAELVRGLAVSTRQPPAPVAPASVPVSAARDGGATNAADGKDSATSVLLSDAGKALFEEALFQQHLLAAEAGELQPLWEDCSIERMLDELCERLRRHPVSEGRRLALRCPEDLRIRTDRLLLQRAVRNLVRNALEACASGDEVTMEGKALADGGAEILVHNPQVMAKRVQEQMFKRSFSTKAATGRGVGTHAARLFVERFLHGRIGFASAVPDGTTFWVRLPAHSPTDTALILEQ
jgi:hypothetical protein